MFNNSV